MLPEDELVIINKLLLIKLKRNLAPEDITSLETLANSADTSQIRMAANILLENKYEARKIFSSLSPESQKEMESFPIYQLL